MGKASGWSALEYATAGCWYGYMLVFIFRAVLFQVKSNVPPFNDNSPVKYFPSSLPGMLGLARLLMAMEKLSATGRVHFWPILCPVNPGEKP
jgi:hypothetical protein